MTCFNLVAVSLFSLPFGSPEKAKEDKASRGCVSIAQACEAYAVNPQNKTGAYPAKLAELVKPPFGGASFIRNGKDDLLDPWGNAFQYAVEKDKKGRLRPFAWSTRTVDGKTKVFGERPPSS